MSHVTSDLAMDASTFKDDKSGKVLWHLTMSLDGFIAGPDHTMDWLRGVGFEKSVVNDLIETTGAILAGRRGYDAGVETAEESKRSYGKGPEGEASRQAYGGQWSGPIFVLTHHPEDALPDPSVTFINCDITEAVAIGLDAAGGKNLEIFGADIARQCVERGLVDEFYVHLAPVMIGDGIRLFDKPGIEPVRWERIHDGGPNMVVDLRYRPATKPTVSDADPNVTRLTGDGTWTADPRA